ncbi:MAG: peptide deformylase [Bacteroidales bacterium]|nr:peptide deformylase [Bacteroidales bacterium]
MELHKKLNEKPFPIMAYGNNVLRDKCSNVNLDSNIKSVSEKLRNTLTFAQGIGLAAPQINIPENIFIVDSKLMYEELSDHQRNKLFSGDKGIQEAFINASIISESDDKWYEMEACLSIPGLNEPIERSWEIIIEYYDLDFNLNRKQYSGFTAKVIQHEYDHINGILFIDHLLPLKKKLLKNKLNLVKSGKIETDYPIKYLKY